MAVIDNQPQVYTFEIKGTLKADLLLCPTVENLKKQLQAADDRINEIECKSRRLENLVEALWYSPGMPGAEMSKNRFSLKINRSAS